MNKEELRKYYINKRAQLTPSEVKNWSKNIAKTFFTKIDLEETKCIHSFLPIQNNNEVDTWEIIRKVWLDFKEIKTVVPITVIGERELKTCLLEEGTSLVMNSYKTPEPSNPIYIDNKEVDVVLIPLLAYDEQGNRVGYGKGYYDSFIANCRPDILKVGLSFFKPESSPILDINEWDRKLDFCVTPDTIYSF